MIASPTFINRTIHFCSYSYTLKSEIQYLKATAIDRDCNPSITDTALFKLQLSRFSHSPQSFSLSSTNIVLSYFPKSSLHIAEILNQCDCTIIFTLVNELTFSKLNDPLVISSSSNIYSITCNCGLFSYI